MKFFCHTFLPQRIRISLGISVRFISDNSRITNIITKKNGRLTYNTWTRGRWWGEWEVDDEGITRSIGGKGTLRGMKDWSWEEKSSPAASSLENRQRSGLEKKTWESLSFWKRRNGREHFMFLKGNMIRNTKTFRDRIATLISLMLNAIL